MEKKRAQKSTSLVVPILEMNSVDFYANLVNSYIGDSNYTGDNSWANYLCIEMNASSPSYLLQRLRNHK